MENLARDRETAAWSNRLSVQLTAVFVFILIIVAIGIAAVAVTKEKAVLIDKQLASEATKAKLAEQRFATHIADIRQDVFVLSVAPPIQGIVRAMQDPDGYDAIGKSTLAQWRERLETIFKSFALGHQIYAQIRFIGAADGGREIVRVDKRNAEIHIVSENDLQQKGERDYFIKTAALPQGKVYVSNIELNREHGKIEEPHWPTLRMGTPIYEPGGKFFGIVIINIDARPAIDFLIADEPTLIKTYLVNEDGTFLAHPDDNKTYGKDLGHHFNWRDEFPGLGLGGPDEDAQEMYASETVKSLDDGQLKVIEMPLHIDLDNHARHLYLLYATPLDAIAALSPTSFSQITVQTVLVALVLGALMMVFVQRRLKPLEDLTDAARKVGQGLWDAELPNDRSYEIKTLTTAFRKMVSRLRARDNAPVLILSVDIDDMIIYVNDALCTALGYVRDEMLGQHLAAFVDCDEDTIPIGFECFRCENCSARITAKNGHKIDVLISGEVEDEQDGTPSRALLVLTDISAINASRAALRERQAELERAQILAKLGIWRQSIATGERQWSDQFYRLLGYEPKALLPSRKAFLDAVHAEDRAHIASLIQPSIAGSNRELPVFRVVHPNGEIRYLKADIALEYDKDGSPATIIGTMMDVTDLKLSEQQLQQSQKMEAIGNLTGGIAHDFNNLLGIIMGNLELLQRRAPGDAILGGFIDDALDATKRGADLTHRLLAFARRQHLEPEALDPNGLLQKMETLLCRTLGTHIEIETDLGPDMPSIKADPAQLESSLLNLAINARDAMPDGGRLILKTAFVVLDADYVAHTRDAVEGPHVCISVYDTGCGMPKELTERIFEPFFTTKDLGKGTGLGLSMVYGFLKQSGGHVTVYSEQGHGTVFKLYLPCSDENVAVRQSPPIDTDLPTGNATILLVEDEQKFRKLTAVQLEELGYTVVSAENGVAAMEKLRDMPRPDLLLTDMIMPGGIDGHQLSDKFRDAYPDLPVLLMSGFPRDAFSERRRYPLLQKPFTHEQLARMVNDALMASHDA